MEREELEALPPAVASLVQTVEADAKAFALSVEAAVAEDAKILWNDFKVLLLALQPQEYAILAALVEKGVADVVSGDIADLETYILNNSGPQQIKVLETLGSSLLQALIALIKANLTPKTPVANTAA